MEQQFLPIQPHISPPQYLTDSAVTAYNFNEITYSVLTFIEAIFSRGEPIFKEDDSGKEILIDFLVYWGGTVTIINNIGNEDEIPILDFSIDYGYNWTEEQKSNYIQNKYNELQEMYSHVYKLYTNPPTVKMEFTIYNDIISDLIDLIDQICFYLNGDIATYVTQN